MLCVRVRASVCVAYVRRDVKSEDSVRRAETRRESERTSYIMHHPASSQIAVCACVQFCSQY